MTNTALSVVGNSLLNSSVGQGIMNLLKDAGTFLMILGPIIGVIVIIILLLKKSSSEANEPGSGKNYNKSILVCVVCVISCFLVGTILTVIGGYFNINVNV